MVSPSVRIEPEEASNKDFYIEYPSNDAFTDDVAYMAGEYTIKVVSSDNPDYNQEATLYVVAITAPETWEMEVGDNYDTDLLREIITVVPDAVAWDIAPAETDAAAFENGVALEAGEYTLVVSCREYPDIKAEIKVTVKEPVTITFPASLTISKLKDTELTLTITEGIDSFDPELLDIRIEWGSTEYLPIIKEVEGSNGLKWNIRGNAVGRYGLSVSYDEKPMFNDEKVEESMLNLPVEIQFNHNGWDWIYYPSVLYLKNDEDGSYQTWLNDGNNRIIEIRLQTDLLYNDATLGIFGSLNELTPEDGMYKIKAEYANADDAVIIDLSGDCYWNNNEGYTKEIVKGYNWIGYPNEWNMTVADLNTLENTAYEGDMIIGKTGFATYSTQTGWVAESDFAFQVGKGYLYYCTGENGIPNGFSFDFTPESSSEVAPPMGQSVALATQRAAAESVWQYDAGQFADNMAIVAEIPQLDFPADYTVGAFVGDECRGMGSAVQGGKMMISVAGKAGERVTFRLHNELTGEFIDLNETLTYAQRAGSLKNPVVLTSDAIVTGIAEVEASDDAAVQGIFDLSGRRVENMNAGGIYIVKTLENGKVVARKVIK